MFCYTVYEHCNIAGRYLITDQANLELDDLDEAKAEVEHCLPSYIYEREWTEGEEGTHWLVHRGLVDALVCLNPNKELIVHTPLNQGGSDAPTAG